MTKRRVTLVFLSFLSLICLLAAAILAVPRHAAAEEEAPLQITWLSDFEYEVYDYSGSAKGTVDRNAKNGGLIMLGPANGTRQFEHGISLLTISNSEAATVTIKPAAGFGSLTLFNTDFGIDRASAGSVRFVFEVDGVKKLEKTVSSQDFHGNFQTPLEGVEEIRISVFGAQGTCASLGDPSFYVDSPNAVTKYACNIVSEGGWAVPLQRNYDLYGNRLTIGQTVYDYGFCINSIARFELVLGAQYEMFSAYAGISEYVAAGSEAGSVTVTLEALAEDGSVLRTVSSPVLYGYMAAYPIAVNVRGAARLRISVGNGGDGISDDMTIIASPEFSSALGKTAAYLGDYAVKSSNLGGEFAVDKKSDGTALSYTHGSDTLNFAHGVGFSLKNKNYESYVADEGDTASYSEVAFDVAKAHAKYFEGLLISADNGVYAEFYADGTKIAEAQALDRSVPVYVGFELPEAATFAVRLIAKETGGGQAELLNARLAGKGGLFGGIAKETETAAAHPYPFGRDISPLGGDVKMLWGNSVRGVSSAITLYANSSVTFSVEEGAELFSASVGLLQGYTGTVTAKVTAHYADGSSKVSSTGSVTANSRESFNWMAGTGVQTLTLSAEGTEGAIVVFGEPSLVHSEYGAVERVADLKWTSSASGWGSVHVDADINGKPIDINGVRYERGISMHAFENGSRDAHVEVNLPDGMGYTLFYAHVGVSRDTDNGGASGSVKFYLEGDGETIWASNLVRVSDDPVLVLADITGVSRLNLCVDNGDGSWNCDFAVWVDPVIARGSEYLDPYLRLDRPVSNQSVGAGGSFTVAGTLLGAEKTVKIYLNDALAGTATADEYGAFTKVVNVQKSGKNILRVEGGGKTVESVIYIAGASHPTDAATIEATSVKIGLEPTDNGILVKQLTRTGGEGHEWLDTPSFIRLPDEVRLGGENGTPYTIAWTYEKKETARESVTSKAVDVDKHDYSGQKEILRYTFKDGGGKFTAVSEWWYYTGVAGPVSHKIDFINESGEPVYVTAADTLALAIVSPAKETLTASYAYKGSHAQSAYGYNLDNVNDGYNMEVFCDATYNNEADTGFMPWVSMHAGEEGLTVGIAWSDCRLLLNGTGNGAYVAAGMRDRFETVIPAGETYYIPEVLIDTYEGSVDDGSNQLKKWLFAFSMPEVNRLDDMLPSYEFNLWELLDTERRSWRMSDEKFYTGVYQLSELGVEEIMIDTYWWKNVGDWRGVHEKWQSTMQYSAEYVHSLGMNFGIYMQAGNEGSNHSDALTGAGIFANPNWFARGSNLSWDEVCFADPDAFAYVKDYLKNYFVEFGLDGIRTDFGYILGYCTKKGHDHIDTVNDVAYWTTLRTYELLDEMYELFPVPTDVNEDSEVEYFKWEDCNCGGTMKDFASLRRATRVQTTDTFTPLDCRRGFYDASYMFPTMQLLLWMNDYMHDPAGPFPNDNYRFWSQLMGAPCPMISMPSDMSPETYAALANSIQIYKNWMRELVKYGDLYHILPRPDGVHWDGVQYFDADTGKGAVLAFKPDPDGTVEDTVTLKFDGIDPDKNYHVWSEEGYIPYRTYKGSDLIKGLSLTIEESYGAEIIYFMEEGAEGLEDVISVPKAFTVTAEAQKGGVHIRVTPAEKADYYIFTLEKGAEEYSFIADEEGALSNLVYGLSAGEYKLTVDAVNRFGSTKQETTFTVEEDGMGSANVDVTGGNEGEIVIDGARYIKGGLLDLTDTTFGVSLNKTLTVKNLGGREKLALRLALGGDKTAKVRVTVSGVKGTETTQITAQDIDKTKAYTDLTVACKDYDSLTIKAENISPDVYLQTALGYGRTGLYGGKSANSYEFSFDVQVLLNGLNETYPRAGGFAAYVSDDRFAAIYIDAYYSNIVIVERTNGIGTEQTLKYKREGFDYYASHKIRIVRSGNTFTYYVDGTILATRTLTLAASQVALITEDVRARFENVVRTVNGEEETLTFRQKNTDIVLLGVQDYGAGKITVGVWTRPELKFYAVFGEDGTTGE